MSNLHASSVVSLRLFRCLRGMMAPRLWQIQNPGTSFYWSWPLWHGSSATSKWQSTVPLEVLEVRDGRRFLQERMKCLLAGRSMVLQRELRIADRGENIKVGNSTEVHIMSAINRKNTTTPHTFNVVLIAWVDQRTDKHNFVCCFTTSTTYTKTIQAQAQKLFSDKRIPTVPLRYALFACTLDLNEMRNSSTNNTTRRSRSKHFLQNRFKYVAFSENTCQKDVTLTAHEIIKPDRVRSRSNSTGKDYSVAVCMKVAYGELSSQALVEWFEFARIIGVSVVHVYYHIISEATMTVFKYYEDIGFAVLSPVTPAVLKGHPPRGFQRPRLEKQSWMDGVVACNDCLHRLHRYPFIAILDFDELLVPLPPYRTLSDVLEATLTAHPHVGSLYIDSYIVVLDWLATDNVTSVSFLRHLDRTVSNRLDNSGSGKSSPKVIVLPERVTAVSTHDFSPRGNYTGRHISKDKLTFLHYRSCKQAKWKGCGFERTRDSSLLRFKSRWVQAISRRPLTRLGCGRQYASGVEREAKELSFDYEETP